MSRLGQEETYIVVAGRIRRGADLLLVCQQGPDDLQPNWALPGGVVESGELVSEALVREVREETGLMVTEIGDLLTVTHTVNITDKVQCVAFIFDVIGWDGALCPADPDDFILEASFLPSKEAVARLRAAPWPNMRDPAIAAVQGARPQRSLWMYMEVEGKQELATLESR
ncbi:MAG: NUDIX hydrolase [Chloroflexi bacterium]|nr:NUDIX hydrolase [Chloroflexota bacterium]